MYIYIYIMLYIMLYLYVYIYIYNAIYIYIYIYSTVITHRTSRLSPLQLCPAPVDSKTRTSHGRDLDSLHDQTTSFCNHVLLSGSSNFQQISHPYLLTSSAVRAFSPPWLSNVPPGGYLTELALCRH